MHIETLEGRVLMSGTTTQTFTIDSALSYATGSGVVTVPTAVNAAGNPVGPTQNIALSAQAKGSLTNHASGTITVATSATSIQFQKASIKAGIADAKATPGGSANFAALFTANFKDNGKAASATFYLDIKGLIASLTSGKLAMNKGKFSNKGETFVLTAGTLGLYESGTVAGKKMTFGPGYAPLSSFAKSVANQSTAMGSLTVDSKGNETLTIIASGSITENLGGLTAKLSLAGQIVAHAHI